MFIKMSYKHKRICVCVHGTMLKDARMVSQLVNDDESGVASIANNHKVGKSQLLHPEKIFRKELVVL